MSQLFSSYRLRDLHFRNRVFVSPMCQYSSRDGFPNDWHMVHLGSRAVGGAGLVMVEATGVSPAGRISAADTGIWSDDQAKAFQPIVRFVREHGAVPAIQLAHAGRKASCEAPWDGGRPISDPARAWTCLAPSALAFEPSSPVPQEMSEAQISQVTDEFRQAAKRSLLAGFDVVEVHMAHGYLLHEFLSPLSNQRKDRFGGSLENRIRFPVQVAQAVRDVWPQDKPVFVRISASDWAPGGWDLEQSLVLCSELKKIGIDLIDVSSGGLVPDAKIKTGPGYQIPFAEAIKKKVQIPAGAVGMITEAQQAEEIVSRGQADVVLLARELLWNPYWPLHAARELGAEITWPKQYMYGRK